MKLGIFLTKITIFLPVLIFAGAGYSQGTFQNLNFESANVAGNSTGDVPISNALPGWDGYIGNNQVSQIAYNSVSLGAAVITLQSSSSRPLPIAGDYSVLLAGQFNPNNVPGRPSAAIAQTGQIPIDAQSLVFWTGPSDSLQPAFAGQIISLVRLETTLHHIIWGGDISAFAGQTGELRFTALSGSTTGGILDNIGFSPTPIPEPSIYFLFGCGVLFLAFGRGGLKKRDQ